LHPTKLIRWALRLFRRSLQARYVAASVVLSTIALIAVGGFLSYSIGAGLFSARVQQVLKDSTRAVTEVQSTFSSASATDEATLQSLLNSVIPALESSASSEPRQVALLRSPGQASAQLLQSPISLNLETAMIPEELRAMVRKTPGKLVYQSISLPALDGNHPALVVGAPLDIPVAGSYELYLVYDLKSAQQTLDFVQNTLFFGGLILIFLIGGVAQFVSARLVAPIRITADVARQISEGALDRRVPSKGEDVVAQLAQSFRPCSSALFKTCLTNCAHL
jgi:two-component system, OmpR family, sensor histidine kinase MtrB